MAVEVPQNERFLEEEEMEGERKSVLLSVEEEQIRGAYMLNKESEEKLFREMLTITSRRG